MVNQKILILLMICSIVILDLDTKAQTEKGNYISPNTINENLYIEIAENWKYHPGDNPVWANSNFNDSSWTVVDSRLFEDQLLSMMYEGYQDLNYMWLSDLIENHMSKLALATQGIIVGLVEECAEDLINSGE